MGRPGLQRHAYVGLSARAQHLVAEPPPPVKVVLAASTALVHGPAVSPAPIVALDQVAAPATSRSHGPHGLHGQQGHLGQWI